MKTGRDAEPPLYAFPPEDRASTFAMVLVYCSNIALAVTARFKQHQATNPFQEVSTYPLRVFSSVSLFASRAARSGVS